MNISIRLIFNTVLCLVFFLNTAAFADDYHYVNILVGDRASGLGGAYTALSDDPAGCFYNPAGIAFAPYTSLSASVNAFYNSLKTYKNTITANDGSTHDWEQESTSLLPNFFGLVRKLGFGVVGVSYAVPDSIQRRQKQNFTYLANDIESYTINVDDSDATYMFGPSYAYKFSDSLSVGTTLYAYYRDSEYIRNHMVILDSDERELSNYYLTKEDWGCKPIIGAIWEPLDSVAIGLTFSKIFVLSSDNDEQFIYWDTINAVDDPIFLFNTTGNSTEDRFPFTVSLGVAYFVSPKLLFSGDVVYYEEVSDKESVVNVSLGTEYYFTDSLAVRGGFFTDFANTPSVSSSKTNQDENVDIYGINSSLTLFHRATSITLGASYGFGKGDAQVFARSSAKQDVEIENISLYLSSSYRF